MENPTGHSSPLDSDMEDDEGALPVKSGTKSGTKADHLVDEENVTLSQLKSAPEPISSTKPKKSKKLTPKDLYAKVEQSRDKLFFIAYTAPDESEEEKWYLVRVDLETCKEVAQDCETSGKYYVEFYTKATSDQSKLDSEARWWLIWNVFSFKRGEMIIGTAREHDPNQKWALKRRLGEHSKVRNDDGADAGDTSMVGFGPNLEKFTTYSDIVNLADPKLCLVGPFNFEAVHAKYIETEGDIGNVSPKCIFVRDRVPMSRWMELVQALDTRGSDIVKPIIQGKKKKRKSLNDSDEKKLAKSPRDDKKQTKSQPACQLCGKVDLGKESVVFDATSSLPAFCVHQTCGLQVSSSVKGRKIITTREVIELVEQSVKDIRHASASDGEVYCVLDEFKAKMNAHLDGIAQQISGTKEASTNGAHGLKFPSVLPESEFTTNELQNMPTVFAYHVKADDPSGSSELNAKIAKLDHDVARRREKRLAREYSEESKKTYSNNATKSRSDAKASSGPKPAGNADTNPKPSEKRERLRQSRDNPPLESKPEGTAVKDSQYTKVSPKPLKTKAATSAAAEAKRVADTAEAKPGSSTAVADDPSGLGQVNEAIGMLARISAERSREKRRASSGSADQPPHKVARATSIGDVSNQKLLSRDSSGSTKSTTPKPAKTPKAKRNMAAVYEGPLLYLPAEPAGPFLNIPNLNGWTMRTKNRSSGSDNNTPRSHVDRYFFSPGGRKFRSKPEVVRFLECLTEAQGDEARASAIFVGANRPESSRAEALSGESDRKAGVEMEDGSTFI